jgi:membrane peptidoglycan carboxypeptidase
MSRAYAGIAGSGALPEVLPIRYVTNSIGECIKEYMPRKGDCETEEKNTPDQVVEPNSADVLTQALEAVVTSGTGTAANIGRPVAGKTGTTQDNVDAWFSGYTPQLSTVVWMGYPLVSEKGTEPYIPTMGFCEDPVRCRPVRGIEVTGGSFPADIWAAFMTEAVADMEIVDFPVPTELPTEIVNQAPPAPTFTAEPSPTASKKPKPSPTESEEPSPEPTKEPSPEPTDSGIIPGQSPEPSPSGDGEGNGKGRKKPDDEDDP